MRFDFYFHFDPIQLVGGDIEEKLDQILTELRAIKEGEQVMTQELAVLQEQVAETLDVEESAIALIQGLAEQIAAIKDDPAAIQALADSLHSKSEALAAAVIANTPSASPPPEP